MEAIHFERLQKLADHLLHGKLGHDKFDFGLYNDGEYDKRGCGTLGCAIGELPILYPNDWAFKNEWMAPRLIDSPEYSYPSADAEDFFGIDEDEVEHLFIPKGQNPEIYGGKFLGDYASKEQVANNILAFIEYKKSQQ